MEQTYFRTSKLAQAHQQAPWRFQLLTIGVFTVGLVIIALVAGVYLSVTARTTNIGREIQVMKEENLILHREIADLETRYAALTAVKTMEERAVKMGLTPAKPGQIVYLRVEGIVHEEQVQLAPPTEFAVGVKNQLPESYKQTLGDWARETLLDLTLMVGVGAGQ